MPGYNLEIKEQSVSGMKATEPSDKMNVTGTLEIKVANNGLVPTFTLLQISEFKIGEHVVIENKYITVGVLFGESKVQVEFDTSSSDQKFKRSIAQACLSGTLPVSMLDISATGSAGATGA
ncbi:MAG: hypothetical protein J07AB43_02810, partial [Candidatus Nanosalina sp. J07AB43]